MNLNDLKAAGGFVAPKPVKKRIKWERKGEDTVEFDVHIRRASFGSMERVMTAALDERSRSATLLSEVLLLGENGDEPISYEDAYQLHPGLATLLLNAAREVNQPPEADEKN